MVSGKKLGLGALSPLHSHQVSTATLQGHQQPVASCQALLSPTVPRHTAGWGRVGEAKGQLWGFEASCWIG